MRVSLPKEITVEVTVPRQFARKCYDRGYDDPSKWAINDFEDIIELFSEVYRLVIKEEKS